MLTRYAILAGWLMAVVAALFAFCVYDLLTTSGPIFDLLELISLPHEFHLELLLLIIANVAVSFSFEEYGAQYVARTIKSWSKRWRRFRGKRRADGKVYKAVQRSME